MERGPHRFRRRDGELSRGGARRRAEAARVQKGSVHDVRLPSSRTRATTAAASLIEVLFTVFPFDQYHPETWPLSAELLPHALHATEHALARGVQTESVGRLLNEAGMYLYVRAESGQAKATFERALKIDEMIYGSEHPNVARDVNNLGSLLRDLGDDAGAKVAYEQALRIFEHFLGPDHPNTRIVRGNLESLE